MRIIAGKYRGRKLRSPPSLATRPTSDRLRETLFDILAPQIDGARFLDLCAGTGAVGIEALSRGASHVTFVDQSRKMCGLIASNLGDLNIEGDFEVVIAEALRFLRMQAKKARQPFNIAFFDPPYVADYEAVMDWFGANTAKLLFDDACLIVEHYRKKELKKEYGTLRRYRALNQGDSCLSFYHPS